MRKSYVSPGFDLFTLAPDLLRDHGGITPFKLAASNDETREAAYGFLRQISGEDFDYDIEAWLSWMQSAHE